MASIWRQPAEWAPFLQGPLCSSERTQGTDTRPLPGERGQAGGGGREDGKEACQKAVAGNFIPAETYFILTSLQVEMVDGGLVPS